MLVSLSISVSMCSCSSPGLSSTWQMGQMGAWLSYRDIFFLPADETGGGTSVGERAEQNKEQRLRLNLLNLCHGNTQQRAQRQCFEWLERLFGVQVDRCDFPQDRRDGV